MKTRNMTIDFTTLDDRHQFFNLFSSDCGKCRHYVKGEYRCAAFPEEIPIMIQSGEMKHRKPFKGQINSVVFEPI